MKPSLKFLLFIAVGIELTFIQNLPLNIVALIVSIVYMLWYRVSIKRFAFLFLIGIIPALSAWAMYQSLMTTDNPDLPIIMATRVMTYIFLGAASITGSTMTELMRSFEQNFRMSPTLAYGILGAFNFIPAMNRQIKLIKANSKMRGERLSWVSPKLYMKAVNNSLNWSENLSQAMYSHGFKEGQKRSHYDFQPFKVGEIIIFFAVLALSVAITLIK